MSLFKLLTMMAGLSLLSYNCEGTGAQKIEYIQDVIKQYCPSLMCFQETWLIDSNHNVLDHISNDYRSFSVFGVDHQSKILSGRAYGCVAILVNNASLKLNKYHLLAVESVQSIVWLIAWRYWYVLCTCNVICKFPVCLMNTLIRWTV